MSRYDTTRSRVEAELATYTEAVDAQPWATDEPIRVQLDRVTSTMDALRARAEKAEDELAVYRSARELGFAEKLLMARTIGIPKTCASRVLVVCDSAATSKGDESVNSGNTLGDAADFWPFQLPDHEIRRFEKALAELDSKGGAS